MQAARGGVRTFELPYAFALHFRVTDLAQPNSAEFESKPTLLYRIGHRGFEVGVSAQIVGEKLGSDAVVFQAFSRVRSLILEDGQDGASVILVGG